MRAYQLLPASMVAPVGQLLPILEVVIGAMLVLGLLTRGAAVVSAILFVAFIIGIASVWARGITDRLRLLRRRRLRPGRDEKYPWEIARDVALLALSSGWSG